LFLNLNQIKIYFKIFLKFLNNFDLIFFVFKIYEFFTVIEAGDVVEVEEVVVKEKTVVVVEEVVIIVVVFQRLVEVFEARWTLSLQSKCETSNHHFSISKKTLLDQVYLKHYH
jgi:hypothetical protein